jgi:vesicle-fusing ATPase
MCVIHQMDGVDQLNNVLVIGMTNRKDMIDDALLRPGRFEIHIEISLPDEAGRIQILNIHTSKMKDNKVMAPDVDVTELASLTKNFSGAELQGLVRSATTFAFNRHIKVGTMAGISDNVSDMQITRADFLSALEEVHAAFGVSEEELSTVVDNGIIHFSPDIEVSPLFVIISYGSVLRPIVMPRLSCAMGNSSSSRSRTPNGRD